MVIFWEISCQERLRKFVPEELDDPEIINELVYNMIVRDSIHPRWQRPDPGSEHDGVFNVNVDVGLEKKLFYKFVLGSYSGTPIIQVVSIHDTPDRGTS